MKIIVTKKRITLDGEHKILHMHPNEIGLDILTEKTKYPFTIQNFHIQGAFSYVYGSTWIMEDVEYKYITKEEINKEKNEYLYAFFNTSNAIVQWFEKDYLDKIYKANGNVGINIRQIPENKYVELPKAIGLLGLLLMGVVGIVTTIQDEKD